MDAHLIVHARNREALLKLLPEERARMHFVPDTWLHKCLWGLTSRLPGVVGRVFTGPLLNLLTQLLTRRLAGRLIREHQLNLLHQPTPVSPKAPSLMFGLGVPVVFGPLNGGMTYPPGFAHLEGRAGRLLVVVARAGSHLVHRVMPGKLKAHTVLVANERTRRALPRGIRGRVIELVENGVDLKLFSAPSAERADGPPGGPVRFVFAGRLVDWKGVDHLLRAVSLLRAEVPLVLDVLGDGTERLGLEALSRELDLCRMVTFHGWLPQPDVAARMRSADVFVLPSLWECGGAVVLEAMAAGVPVIATDWGGPADYLDDETGILVKPTNPRQFPQDLAAAMIRLANDPNLRQKLGQAARKKVQAQFDWDRKIDRITEIYESVLNTAARR
ncbi:glycosyltransferase family 4 protein [Cyanobium sp. Cruz-8H5]|uniref:glycosyltransferase family 4 protein n=1 Tax=Cyanobium sp. Cruz-8H5 TaxID=2823712 RepID=UPI0020CED851|nr:glycosyltransferase family 4 protein [Cyanobium sp. Cruz-8H5]